MKKIYPAKYNSLKIGDKIDIENRTYKVKEVSLMVNAKGGTNYLIKETLISKIRNFFFI